MMVGRKARLASVHARIVYRKLKHLRILQTHTRLKITPHSHNYALAFPMEDFTELAKVLDSIKQQITSKYVGWKMRVL